MRDLAHGSVSAGWTEPVGPGRRSGWRSAFAALDWQVDEHRSLSVLVDHSATRDGERTSRSVRVRWDTAGSGGLRWRLQAVRQWDDLERPWVAGASIDWHF